MAFWMFTVQVQQTALKAVLIVVGKSLWNSIRHKFGEKKIGRKIGTSSRSKCSARSAIHIAMCLKTNFWINNSAQLASTNSQSMFCAYRRKKFVLTPWKIAFIQLWFWLFTCLNEELGLLIGVFLCQDLCSKICNENWVVLLIPANRLVSVG